MDLISVHNDGPDIVETDYWATPNAAQGYFYLSINAGAFRLLVPEAHTAALRDWASAREVIISRGPWREGGKGDAIEILIEDGSDSPYVIHMGTDQTDRLPLDADRDLADQPARWIFTAWSTFRIFSCRSTMATWHPEQSLSHSVLTVTSLMVPPD